MKKLQKLIDGLTWQERIVLLAFLINDIQKEISHAQETVKVSLDKIEELKKQIRNEVDKK